MAMPPVGGGCNNFLKKRAEMVWVDSKGFF